MKLSQFLATFFLLFASKAYAGKTPGYFINNANDSCFVTFEINRNPNFISLQSKVKYYDSLTQKLVILHPNMAKEFGFKNRGKMIRMISFKNNFNLSKNLFTKYDYLFMHQIKPGRTKIYNYYFHQWIGIAVVTDYMNYIQTESGELIYENNLKLKGMKIESPTLPNGKVGENDYSR